MQSDNETKVDAGAAASTGSVPTAAQAEDALAASGAEENDRLDDELASEQDGEGGDDDDDSGEEEEEEDENDGEESVTGASELEEEARYEKEDQPACGLSPRLVVRRGVQQLQALDGQDGPAPPLQRIDTIASFERAVGRMDASEGLTSPDPAPISRINTMSGLPEVQEAFAAVGDEDKAIAGGAPATSTGASSSSTSVVPQPVHRIDTMELLLDPSATNDAEGRPPKRTKTAEADA